MRVWTAAACLLALLCSPTTTSGMDVTELFPEVAADLTRVTWAHAVNTRAKLAAALHGGVMMLEADVLLGRLEGQGGDVPIMAHPPDNTSDLSLQGLLQEMSGDKRKGLKLDFKSTEVVEPSLAILRNYSDSLDVPVWLNADILNGPVNNSATPVDAAAFLSACVAGFPNSTLSVGWKTTWPGPEGAAPEAGGYTAGQARTMLGALREHAPAHARVTFPVRAGPAAQSLPALRLLLDGRPGSTLTVWSADGDPVDAAQLSTVILALGKDRVYLDVPSELAGQLDLSEQPS